jgi:hypothetical protein
MRPGPVLLLAVTLTATAILPGMALAQEDHSAHGDEGPANPMVKQVLLYLQGDGTLAPTPAEAGTVPAGAALPDGSTQPVLWEIEATKNTLLDSSVFVDLYARATRPSLVAGGPEGAAFRIQLAHNGEPVEGAESDQRLPSTLLTGQEPEPVRLKLFLPQVELALAAGDKLGLMVSYFGLNPQDQPAIEYLVGGDAGSQMGLRLRMASLAELGLPAEVGPWPVAPMEDFDLDAAQKREPAAKVFTLRAFQFGYRASPAPLSVPNGSKVILQLLVDETLSTAGEGHAGHGHDANASWDQNLATPLHGFSLAQLDPRLSTVLFDGLVVTMSFTADKPGNYTFFCTVVCGTGHGGMLDRLTVEGAAPPPQTVDGQTQGNPARPTPGFELVLALGAVGLAVLARRRRL